MRFFTIAAKDLKEIIRDKKGLAFILIFPIMLLILSGLFVTTEQGSRPHDIAIINYDQGSTLDNGDAVNYSDNLTQYLKESTYRDSKTHLFNVITTNESNANNLLNNGKIDAELIIPENFSDATVAMIDDAAQTITDANSSATTANLTSTVIIRGDTQSNDFAITQSILTGELNIYQDNLVTHAQTDTLGTIIAEPSDYVNSVVESNGGGKTSINFDSLIPGILIFSILLLAIMVAIGLTREEESGGLSRLKLSKITAFDLLFGGLIPWTLILVVQIVLLLFVTIALGFHSLIDLSSLVLILLIGTIGGIASISLGIVIAAFTRNNRQAISLGIILIIPITFIAVFQLPQISIVSIAGYHFQFIDILPWTNVFKVLQTTLVEGISGSVFYNFLWASISTLILFMISLGLYSRKKLSDKIEKQSK